MRRREGGKAKGEGEHLPIHRGETYVRLEAENAIEEMDSLTVELPVRVRCPSDGMTL